MFVGEKLFCLVVEEVLFIKIIGYFKVGKGIRIVVFYEYLGGKCIVVVVRGLFYG